MSNVTYFLHNVTYFRSLAVLRGGFVELYNLVHGLTGLTPLVHFFGIKISHLVGAVPGDSLNLTVGAASFQEVDGCVLTKAVERVVFVEAAQTKTATLWLPILLQSSLAQGLASGTVRQAVRAEQRHRKDCLAATFSSGKFGL